MAGRKLAAKGRGRRIETDRARADRLQRELDTERVGRDGPLLTFITALPTLYRWSGAALIAVYVADALQSTAGLVTDLSVQVSVPELAEIVGEGCQLTGIQIGTSCPGAYLIPGGYVVGALGFVIGAVGCGLAFGFRRLHKRTIERYHPERVRREQEIDPGRTSSTLTHVGDTNPEDRV